MRIQLVDRWEKGGSLKRSLGMAFTALTIPKAYGFEAATQLKSDNLHIHT